jgi:hypothetical protein
MPEFHTKELAEAYRPVPILTDIYGINAPDLNAEEVRRVREYLTPIKDDRQGKFATYGFQLSTLSIFYARPCCHLQSAAKSVVDDLSRAPIPARRTYEFFGRLVRASFVDPFSLRHRAARLCLCCRVRTGRAVGAEGADITTNT